MRSGRTCCLLWKVRFHHDGSQVEDGTKDMTNVWGAVWYAGESPEVVMRVALILDPSFDLEAGGWDGRTVLMRACHEGMLKVAQVLVEAGADVHARDDQTDGRVCTGSQSGMQLQRPGWSC